MTREAWEVVTEVQGDLQAEILGGLLEAQGIRVWLSQEGAGRAYQIGVGRLGRVQILVAGSDSQRAREVLESYRAGEFEEKPDNDDQIERENGEIEE